MWRVDYDPKSARMLVRLSDQVPPGQMRGLVKALDEALDCTAEEPFHALVDLRGLTPLDVESVELFAAAKRTIAERAGCAGVAVLADGATVVMQQRRTTSGARELVTLSEEEAEQFLGAG